jgi:hypothetical protein
MKPYPVFLREIPQSASSTSGTLLIAISKDNYSC